MIPGAPQAIPYQMRHGAASHASALENMGKVELMERLRHTSEQSTQRYSRHVRYLAELEKVKHEVVVFADAVESKLSDILGKHAVPKVPKWLKRK